MSFSKGQLLDEGVSLTEVQEYFWALTQLNLLPVASHKQNYREKSAQGAGIA